MNRKHFILCGLTGWCMELLFTSLGTIMQGDFRLIGQTSIWMFPIYGMAAFIYPVYQIIKRWPTICRCFLYSICILGGEFISGSLLNFFSVCPWDYTDSPYNINGIIRLDYIPYWMAAGLVFERLLCGQGTQKKKTNLKNGDS